MSLELAWAAGFFDGEGSTIAKVKKPGRLDAPRGHACVGLQLSQVEPEPLRRFAEAVEYGRVRGPYRVKNPKGRPIYEWGVNGAPALQVLALLRPYLSEPKRVQADRAIASVAAWHAAHPITNPGRNRPEKEKV